MALADKDDIAGLMRWEAEGPASAEFHETLKASRGFARAARAPAVNMPAAGAADGTLDGVFDQ
jgi:hypothetical protein